MEKGVIPLYNEIRNRVRKQLDILLEDSDIGLVIREKNSPLSAGSYSSLYSEGSLGGISGNNFDTRDTTAMWKEKWDFAASKMGDRLDEIGTLTQSFQGLSR